MQNGFSYIRFILMTKYYKLYFRKSMWEFTDNTGSNVFLCWWLRNGWAWVSRLCTHSTVGQLQICRHYQMVMYIHSQTRHCTQSKLSKSICIWSMTLIPKIQWQAKEMHIFAYEIFLTMPEAGGKVWTLSSPAQELFRPFNPFVKDIFSRYT